MIKTAYSFKNLSVSDKQFVREYFGKKIERIEHLLQRFDGAACRLDLKAEKFATKSAYFVELTLHLPGYRFMAAEDDHTLAEALDLAVDKMIIQLRKFREIGTHRKKEDLVESV